MKKVMFMIVGMLMSFGVSAATLTLTNLGDGSLSVNPDETTGQRVSGSAFTPAGASWSDSWGISSVGDAYVNFEVDGQENPVMSISLFYANDLLNALTFDGSPVATNLFSFGYLLLDGMDYVVKVDGYDASSYSIIAQTPIPAALFLFAPALLGFFGLRRKAAVAA